MGASRSALAVAGPVILFGILVGCGEVGGPTYMETNVPPVTTITGGPEPFGEASYRVTLYWYGEDPDGRVKGFEFAWEDTSEWVPATGSDSTFLLACDTCCVFDTMTSSAGADSVVERFFGYHTFFVRAVDEKGAKDPTPAFLTFNATTVAPSTKIVHGPPDGSVSATRVQMEWEGTDPDGFLVGFQYFHATKGELRERYGYEDALGVTRDLWNRLGWRPLPADSAVVLLKDLPTGYGVDGANRHLFFVRSIDDAGAKEQVPVKNVNYREWGVGASEAFTLTIRSNLMGAEGTKDDARPTIFQNSRVVFAWYAETGGVPVTGYSHAYDNLLWSAWDGEDLRFPGEGFFQPTRGRHSFFVRMQDASGAVTTAEFPFEAVPGPSDVIGTNVLFLSGFHVEGNAEFYPPPARYRAFWDDSVLVHFDHDYLDPRTEHDPSVPYLEMGRASTVIGTTDDGEGGRPPVFAEWHQGGEEALWSYLDAGGNVVLLGFSPSWNQLPDRKYLDVGGVWTFAPCFPYSSPRFCGDILVWKGESAWEGEPFDHPMYEYCAVETTWIDETDDFLGKADAVYPGFPDLTPDPSRSREFIRSAGLRLCERSTLRNDRGAVPLYEFVRPGETAAADPADRRIAGHWVPSDGHRGNLVYLGFPMYFFGPAAAREAMETILIELLGEEPRP